MIALSYEARKAREKVAWSKVKREFERHGYQVAALALERSSAFPEVEPLLLQANDPPLLLMIISMPDGFAFEAQNPPRSRQGGRSRALFDGGAFVRPTLIVLARQSPIKLPKLPLV